MRMLRSSLSSHKAVLKKVARELKRVMFSTGGYGNIDNNRVLGSDKALR